MLANELPLWSIYDLFICLFFETGSCYAVQCVEKDRDIPEGHILIQSIAMVVVIMTEFTKTYKTCIKTAKDHWHNSVHF